jgi:hypothetical protein
VCFYCFDLLQLQGRDALASAVEGLKRTNADVASVRADVSLKASSSGRINPRQVRECSYSDQQCGRRWRRALRHVERRELELVTWRQSHGRGLGHRDFCAGHIVSTASIAGLISFNSIPDNVSKYGWLRCRKGCAMNSALAVSGVGSLSWCHPHQHHELSTQFARALCRRDRSPALGRCAPRTGEATSQARRSRR